jgi:hypothetical protein
MCLIEHIYYYFEIQSNKNYISAEELVNYYEMNEEERDRWEQDLSANLSVEFYYPRNFIRWIICEVKFAANKPSAVEFIISNNYPDSCDYEDTVGSP